MKSLRRLNCFSRCRVARRIAATGCRTSSRVGFPSRAPRTKVSINHPNCVNIRAAQGDEIKTILQILRGLTVNLPVALKALLRWLCSSRGREARPPTEQCNTLDSPVVRIPNPLIYDQYYLRSLDSHLAGTIRTLRFGNAGSPVPFGKEGYQWRDPASLRVPPTRSWRASGIARPTLRLRDLRSFSPTSASGWRRSTRSDVIARQSRRERRSQTIRPSPSVPGQLPPFLDTTAFRRRSRP